MGGKTQQYESAEKNPFLLPYEISVIRIAQIKKNEFQQQDCRALQGKQIGNIRHADGSYE